MPTTLPPPILLRVLAGAALAITGLVIATPLLVLFASVAFVGIVVLALRGCERTADQFARQSLRGTRLAMHDSAGERSLW